MNTKDRETNFEVLRIIAMFMIVMHHFCGHSTYSLQNVTIHNNKFILLLLGQGGMLGNNIFALISGYFLSKKDTIKYKRVAKMWGQMFFYSVIIYMFFVFTKSTYFSIKELAKYSFPLTCKTWWFASVYLYLFLISPFLNIIINNISILNYKRMLMVSFVILCLIPTMTGLRGECNNIVWFSFLYFVGGFIEREKTNIKGKWIYLIGAIIGCISLVYAYLVIDQISFLSEHKNSLFEHQYVPGFVIAVLIIVFTSKCCCRSNHIINLISSATFGVYLIHEHEYTRELIWKNVFSLQKHINEPCLLLFLLYCFGVCFLVYIICSIIDLIRKFTIEKLYLKCLDKMNL